MNGTLNETDALIVARKIEMGRKLDANEAEVTDNGATLRIFWEGKVFEVTVKDLGAEED
jgi:hypothetical protein